MDTATAGLLDWWHNVAGKWCFVGRLFDGTLSHDSPLFGCLEGCAVRCLCGGVSIAIGTNCHAPLCTSFSNVQIGLWRFCQCATVSIVAFYQLGRHFTRGKPHSRITRLAAAHPIFMRRTRFCSRYADFGALGSCATARHQPNLSNLANRPSDATGKNFNVASHTRLCRAQYRQNGTQWLPRKH